ncbi:hypothetical protein G9A89_018337 [Geosiphon pyriformis]|nr:hypothetical protein G9A89_018337 [Geosiphon pyriformis]
MPKGSDFQQSGLSEGKAVAPRSNPSNNTIPAAQIAQNANLSDIFPFEFEANESLFLLSNAAVNKQKAITVMYTEATVERKPIQLILDSRSTGIIVTADNMKKTPVREIDNFPFTIDGITILAKVLVMDASQYQAFVKNNWLLKANAKKSPVFEFKEEKKMPLTKTYMVLGSTSNWAKETEQEIFEESRKWKKVWYSTPEPRKEPPYILLKCKDCKKKLSSMRACISPKEEYETHTYYFCKACHRK